MNVPTGVVLAGGALLVWALGLYVISRAPTRRVSILATLNMVCLAAYLGGEALGALAPADQVWADWLRRTWWAPSLAAPIWLVLTLALAREEDARIFGAQSARLFVVVAALALGLGVVFGLAGVLTLLVARWDQPFVGTFDQRYVPAGPWLPAFQVFVVVCLVWSVVNLALLWRASPAGPLRARFAWLFASGSIFLLGGAWIVVASGVYLLPGLPGHVLLILGMAMMGWNLARYGALLAGEQVLGDFLAFAATMLAIVLVYGGIVVTLAPEFAWIERGLPLLLLVMVTHVVVDTRGHLLDRVLYVPLVSTLRGQLRDLANRVVRQPDELSALADVQETVNQILRENDLRVLVEGALRHLNDLPVLSQHQLLTELPVLAAAEGTPLESGARLRNELDSAIERLRPSGARPSPGTSVLGGWLHYLVLKEAYVDGRPNKQIMQRYLLSEGTFHRARRSAIDAVTGDVAGAASHRSAASLPREGR